MVLQKVRCEVPMEVWRCFNMTTVHKKRHGGIRRWLVRNALSLALIGIILLSMTAGAIGCLAFLPKPQDTSTPETKTDVSTATVTQPDITSPSLDPIPEPQVFYFDVPLSPRSYRTTYERSVRSTKCLWSL